eukprot:COSAG04_NODE_1699_length_5892_cov_3.353530_5_plen_66_part_00
MRVANLPPGLPPALAAFPALTALLADERFQAFRRKNMKFHKSTVGQRLLQRLRAAQRRGAGKQKK